MLLDRVSLKNEAKGILRGARVSPYLFTLLFMGISLVLTAVSDFVSFDEDMVHNIYYSTGVDLSFLVLHRAFPAALVTFVSILVSLLSVLLNAGYYRYHLAVRRGEEVPYLGLFDGFSFAGKLILLALVQYIFIFLWTLLFIIPGFIAAYRYRFAVYNLCENPDMGVMEAINMSKAQTAGFKWQLFVLDLSFIGWRILSGLTLNILAIWLNPYIVQTDVGFFQQIKAAKGIGWSPDRGGSGEFRPYDGPDHTDNTGWQCLLTKNTGTTNGLFRCFFLCRCNRKCHNLDFSHGRSLLKF